MRNHDTIKKGHHHIDTSVSRKRNASKKSLLIFLIILVMYLRTWTKLVSLPEIPAFSTTNEEVSPIRNAKGSACLGYKGVLHIAQGDDGGAAGTIFFLFVLNHLIYAERFGLIPWVHLNNVSHFVYDPLVHGNNPDIPPKTLHTMEPSWVQIVDSVDHRKFSCPGRPFLSNSTGNSPMLKEKVTQIRGTGVWNSYFEPVSAYSPNDASCMNLPIIRLSRTQIIPAMHVHCPWSLRAWRYGGLPPSLQKEQLSYDDWFCPMREQGAQMTAKYIHFLPHMRDLAQKTNPFFDSHQCLAIHIRHSDKANRRRRIPVKRFFPYVLAYLQEMSQSTELGHSSEQPRFGVYIATDSHKVLDEIRGTWKDDKINVSSYLHWQATVTRSNDTTPVFAIGSHHSTNTEVLVDILAMSRCQFLLHGLSAVSEATHYLNPVLHKKHSVNLETPNHATTDEFQEWVREERSSGIPSS